MMTELQYKEGPRFQQIKITKREWDKLKSGQYLNDVLILFWVKFYQYYVYPRQGHDPNHLYVFDPQFYSQMIRKTQDSIYNYQPQQTLNFQAVKRWTKKVNIFDKKWLILPICHDEHWSVCVIG
jgi:sentrin-specific protease 7